MVVPHMKKVMAGSLAIALAFTASACGRSSGGDASSTTKPKNAGGPIASAPGYDPATKTITLGVLTPTSTTAKLIGDPLTQGNQVYYDQLNATGGIDGKYKVKLIVEDNKYGSGDSTATATAYNQIKDKVAAFQQVLGTDPVKSILPSLKDDNMIAAPATLDAEWYTEPNLMAILAPYQVQAANALWYYHNKMDGKGKKVCTMTSDDGYGKAGLEGAQFAADQMGFKLADNETFSSALSGGTYTAQVQTLQEKGCDAVWLVSLPTDTIGIFNAAISKDFAPQWIGTSPTWINLLAAGGTADYVKDHYIVAAQGVEWGDTSVPGSEKMLAAVKKFSPKEQPNFYFSFGYVQAQAMAQILAKAIDDGDLSRAGIMNAMNTVGTLKFTGFSADQKYGNPAARVPPRETTLFKVTPDTMATNGGLTLLAPNALNFTSPVAKKVPLK